MFSGPIIFDLTGSVPNGYSMSFAQGGLSLTVSSALYNGGLTGDQAVYEFSTPTLSMTADGIGALNTYDDVGSGFDGHGKYEMATLSFSQAVKITSVTLVPMGTRYNLSGANTQFVMFDQGLVIDPLSRQTIDATDFSNETALYGDFVGIAAYSRNDQFRVASITVEALDLVSAADAFSVKSGAMPTVLAVLSNDVDSRQISGLDVAGVVGTVTLAADGRSVTYDTGTAFDHLATGEVATETFTYTVLGWDGTFETQTVTVTVTGGLNEVTGTVAANLLSGSVKRDIMRGLEGNDTLSGLDGNDDIDGGLDNDRLNGNAGDDLVNGGDGDDFVYGDAGNDTVVGGAGNDRLYGGDGDDSIDGSIGTDRLYGDAGNDVLTGSSLANTMDGGTGIDTMSGGAGSDKYYVDATADTIIELSSAGTDTVYTTADFTLSANVENMIINGSASTNGTGNSHANRLTGNGADNILTGLAGNDRLTGGEGNDKLIGGIGRDNLTGGGGADEFQFAEFGSVNYDTVVDFDGIEDTIQLSAATFGLAPGALQDTAFVLGAAATDAAHRIIYDQANGDLFYDADGSGAGARQLIASLVNGTVLTQADIFVF